MNSKYALEKNEFLATTVAMMALEETPQPKVCFCTLGIAHYFVFAYNQPFEAAEVAQGSFLKPLLVSQSSQIYDWKNRFFMVEFPE